MELARGDGAITDESAPSSTSSSSSDLSNSSSSSSTAWPPPCAREPLGTRLESGGVGQEDATQGERPAARGRADCIVVAPRGTGKLSYYSKGARFECECFLHPRCRLTRTAKANPSRVGQGRPLGLMAAWLALRERVGDAKEHKHAFVTASLSRQDRAAARVQLRACVNGATLESCEAPKGDAEASEPEQVP